MAIQIRRGSNAEWEVNNSNIVVGEPAVATDSKRAFIGTASGAYMELANLEAIAPAYDPGNSYMIGDYVSYQGKLYVCTVPTSGAWNASAWQVTTLGQALAENAYSNYETYTMSGDIVSFPNGAGGIPVKDLKVGIEAVQSGSGDPSPTNVRPISGWDEVNVMRTGKNMFDISTFSANDCMYQYSSSFTHGIGSSTLTKDEDSFTLVRSNVSYAYFLCVGKCLANIPVTISFNVTEGYVFDIDARTEPPTQAPNNDKRFYRDTTVGGQASVTRTFTPEQDGYVYIEIYSTSGNLTNTVANLQYEFGSAKTDYERGNKQTYTTDLDGTCYGGTLDVTTGVLTVTHGYLDLGSTNYVYSSNYGGYFYVGLVGKKAGDTNIYADCYANAGVTSVQYMADSTIKGRTTDSYIFIKDSRFTDAGDLKTALNGHYAVYELATPQVVQLTPTQITTLLGQNNIWCDSGEIEELTYRISNVQ